MEQSDIIENGGWAPLAPAEALSSIGWNDREKTTTKGKSKKRKGKNAASYPTKKAKKKVASIAVEAQSKETIAGHHWNGASGELTIHWASAEHKLCIEGAAQVKVISGTVELLGYRVMEGEETTLNCPSWSNPISISQADCEKEDETVVLRISSIPPSRESLTFKLRSFSDVTPLRITDSWKSGCDTVIGVTESEHVTLLEPIAPTPQDSGGPSSRTLICGAKSTGKSTLLRYLTNRYLSLGKVAVMVLDCDVGQPEGSPPGMLTLSLVEEPLLSPPHLHMKKEHVKAYFYGHVTSRNDPPTYLDMIADLLSAYKAYVAENHGGREEDIPLVVNTDGWVKGFGFEILSTIVQRVQPAFVMQLTADVAAKRFDIESVLSAESNLLCLDAYSLFIESPVPAQALRSLRTCTYFLDDTDIWNKGRVHFGQKGIVDGDCEIANTLATRKPLAVSIHSMRCQVVGLSSQQEHAVLDALNGSIIGLGVDNEGERYPSCVGLGIVRSIDRTRMIFHILTPVASHKLADVTAFIKGSLELPVECVYRGAQADAFPYLSCRRKVEGLGGSVMKSRNNIARKGQGKANRR